MESNSETSSKGLNIPWIWILPPAIIFAAALLIYIIVRFGSCCWKRIDHRRNRRNNDTESARGAANIHYANPIPLNVLNTNTIPNATIPNANTDPYNPYSNTNTNINPGTDTTSPKSRISDLRQQLHLGQIPAIRGFRPQNQRSRPTPSNNNNDYFVPPRSSSSAITLVENPPSQEAGSSKNNKNRGDKYEFEDVDLSEGSNARGRPSARAMSVSPRVKKLTKAHHKSKLYECLSD